MEHNTIFLANGRPMNMGVHGEGDCNVDCVIEIFGGVDKNLGKVRKILQLLILYKQKNYNGMETRKE